MARETADLRVKVLPAPRVDVAARLLPEVTVKDPEFPDWLFFVQVDFDGAVVGFRVVQHMNPTARLTTRALGSVPLHLYARAAHECGTRLLDKWAPNPENEPDAASEFAVLGGRLDIKKPGRRGRSDVAYAQVAAAYVQRLGSPTPLRDLAEAMFLSESQVRGLLFEARRRTLLTKAPPGTAGGSLTHKARRLLEDDRGQR